MKRPIEPLRVACWWRRARKADATSQDTPAWSSDTPLPGRADGSAVLQVLLSEPVWNPDAGMQGGRPHFLPLFRGGGGNRTGRSRTAEDEGVSFAGTCSGGGYRLLPCPTDS